MTVSTGAATPGTYTVTVTGTSGALVHSTTVTLVVQAAAPGSFNLSSAPTSRTISARGSANYAISVVNEVNFSGTVTFSVSGLPARTSASFSPASSATGTTLTVKASPNVKAGTSTLTITGASGALTSQTTVTLVIQ
jgi:uncharacterized membrane protein